MEYILRQVFITLTLLTLIQISSSQGGDGGFTDWTQWTTPSCDVTCGQNVLTLVFRNRGCRFTPSNCTGTFLETKQIPCNIPNCPVDGGYSPWGSWVSQACSATCQGTQQVRRTRLCDNPSPQFNGRTCQGTSEEIEQRSCGDEKCPGEDLMSEWSAWSSPQCQVTCGGVSGIVTRTRLCVRADNTTIGCTAILTESEMRDCGPSYCPVHGGVSVWDNWGAYGPCSPSCGANGIRQRKKTRTCVNPVPAYGGRFCAQPLVDTDTIGCDPVPCQVSAINGGMSMWSVWGEVPCSATCGPAVRNVIRNRTCTNPAPQYGGDDCREPSSESMTRTCTGLPSCPTFSTLTGGILVGVVILLGILLIFIIVGILWYVCCRKDEVRYKEENIRQSEFHQYHNVKSGFLKPPYYNLEK